MTRAGLPIFRTYHQSLLAGGTTLVLEWPLGTNSGGDTVDRFPPQLQCALPGSAESQLRSTCNQHGLRG